MGRKQTTTYAIGWEAKKNYPAITRELLRELECAEQQHNFQRAAVAAEKLVDIMVETQDVGKTEMYAKKLLMYWGKVKGKFGLQGQSKAFYHLAEAYRQIGNYAASLAMARDYRVCARKLQSQEDELQADFETGLTYLAMSENHTDDDPELVQQEIKKAHDKFAQVYQAIKDSAQTSRNQEERERHLSFKIDTLLNLGITFRYQERFDKAIHCLNAALKSAMTYDDGVPQRRLAYCNLALTYEEKGDFKTALDFTNKEMHMIKQMGDDSELLRVLWDLALRYRKIKNYEAALEQYQRYIDVAKRNVVIEDNREAVEEEIQKTKAEISLTKDIQKYTTDLQRASQQRNTKLVFALRGSRGEAHLRLENYAEAADDFAKQIQISRTTVFSTPDVIKLHINMGQARLGLKQYAEAKTSFRNALNMISSSDLAARVNCLECLGDAMVQDGDACKDIVATFEEMLSAAKLLGSVKQQLEALSQLESIYEQYNYQDRAREIRMKIKKLERQSGHFLTKDLDSEEEEDEVLDEFSDSNAEDEEIDVDLADTPAAATRSRRVQLKIAVPNPRKDKISPATPTAETLRAPELSPTPAKKVVYSVVRLKSGSDKSSDRKSEDRAGAQTRNLRRGELVPRPQYVASDVEEDEATDDDGYDYELSPRSGREEALGKLKQRRKQKRRSNLILSSPLEGPQSLSPKRKIDAVSNPTDVLDLDDEEPSWQRQTIRIDSSPIRTEPESAAAKTTIAPTPSRKPKFIRLDSSSLNDLPSSSSTAIYDSGAATCDVDIDVDVDAHLDPFDSNSAFDAFDTHEEPTLPIMSPVQDNPLDSKSEKVSPASTDSRRDSRAVPSSAATDVSPLASLPPSRSTTPPIPSCSSKPMEIQGLLPLVMPQFAAYGHTSSNPEKGSETPEILRTPTRRRPKPSSPVFKVRVEVEGEVLGIPCHFGPMGTPKTIRWLTDEAQRRYKDINGKQVTIAKLVFHDPETNEDETLFKNDAVSDVLKPNQKVIAITNRLN
ncbi:uncharacterized protein BJ171DRAFT_251583 [Polychytrium aggregatum]|uniref:uncharacterized protein n=1 Tax=Polychytrium aggregatum TaxID=110093 RepID=UPI0022FF441C|nr:uncharacterized protein BJ171DRAFT_251583 [Polychytrium aggregatum]KAI9193591.1 hypothetical protein BJ171DRAFT_251583 [Polychytrium aggregatum]